MVSGFVRAAIIAAVFGSFAAQAQTIAQIGDPAELPPSGFKGAQYVDSRGCVFMRISSAGRTSWYPRVNRDRKVVCGMPPSFSAAPAIEVAEDAPTKAPAPKVTMAPAVPSNPAPRGPGAPIATVASAMMPEALVVKPQVVAAPVAVVKPAPKGRYETAAANGPPKGKIGCYTSAPVAEVVRLRNGGTAVVCTRGDGSLTGWRPPIYPSDAGVGAALGDPVAVLRADTAIAAAPVVVPKGYKLAWSDDRLNPQRGIGTAAGQAAQDQIWTKDVPQKLVADVAPKKAKKPVEQVTVSTKNAPKDNVASGDQLWVQVGTFGVAANAAGASQRLAALGLPAAKAKLHKGGKDLQMVLAGPFASQADARSALQTVRGAGFGDAFLR